MQRDTSKRGGSAKGGAISEVLRMRSPEEIRIANLRLVSARRHYRVYGQSYLIAITPDLDEAFATCLDMLGVLIKELNHGTDSSDPPR